MKIEFPAKFEIKRMPDNGFSVQVPVDVAKEVTETINGQDWASALHLDAPNVIAVYVNYGAYEITPEQAEDALRAIIQEAMKERVDMNVWGDALNDE